MSAPTASALPAVRIRRLGRRPYEPVWRDMQRFTDARGPATPDEIWCVEHPPVYTLGLAGREAHVLDPGGTPVVRCDRGGQVTYHGPGQAVVYTLVDLRRAGLGPRAWVEALEQAVIDLLAEHGIAAAREPGAPGVYVEGAKVAALGLRVRRGAAYHGLAVNVDMDLAPFARIDPCGRPGQPVTRLADLGVGLGTEAVALDLAARLAARIAARPGAAVL